MTRQEHLESLRHRHARLEDRLHEEMLRPFPDTLLVTRLKRQKLHIKDELSRASRAA